MNLIIIYDNKAYTLDEFHKIRYKDARLLSGAFDNAGDWELKKPKFVSAISSAVLSKTVFEQNDN